MISEKTILEAVHALQNAAPGSTVILFGSYGRGTPHARSDLDFLVIEDEVKSRRAEIVRLCDVLLPLRVAADVLVVSRGVFADLSAIPGTVYYWARKEGRVFDVSA